MIDELEICEFLAWVWNEKNEKKKTWNDERKKNVVGQAISIVRFSRKCYRHFDMSIPLIVICVR